MLKNYKILLLIVALTATGIAFILVIWLYGSFKSEREQLVGTAERSLFNVLQNYHQSEYSEEQTDSTGVSKRHRGLLSFLERVYPGLDLKPMQTVLDSSDRARWDARKEREKKRGKDASREVLPLYLLEKIDFNRSVLKRLESELRDALTRNGIRTHFALITQEMERDSWDDYMLENRKSGILLTRPILVNPERDQFLFARFDNPWGQLFRVLWGQALISLILLSTLIGTFVYLFKTIRKQSQLAELRKAFVNNMTHELKTPVSTVMAAVEAIQRFVNSEDKERMNKYLDLSKGELEHLHNMIERVLQFDVDETSGIHLIKESFDVVGLVQNCLETVKVSRMKTVHTTLLHESERIILKADQGHLKNVVSNLLDNAIKYSGDPVEITVRLEEREHDIEISVRDQGKGIAKTHINHVFDMFYRVPEGNLHEVKGFGLGLAYVRQVVLQHGGKVTVSSEPMKGSIFVINIPKN